MSQHGPNDGCGELLWEHMSAEPGFDEELRQATTDIAEGRGVPFSAAPQPLDVEKLVDAANAVLYASRKRPVTQEEERALALLDAAADEVGARLGAMARRGFHDHYPKLGGRVALRENQP